MATALRKSINLAVKSVDRTKREFKFIASSQEVDRDREVVIARGIQTANFDRNPVMLIDHDRGRVLGRIDSKWIETVDGADALIMLGPALPPGVSADADQVYGEILHGARSAFSISFLPLEYDYHPIPPGQTGRTFRKVELLEVSSVSLPSSPGAVVIDKNAPDGSSLIRLPDVPAQEPMSELERVLFTRQAVREALVNRVSEVVRRQVRGDDLYLNIVDDPRQGAAHAMRHHVGNDPTIVTIDPAALKRMATDLARKVLAEGIEAGVARAIRRARGRVD